MPVSTLHFCIYIYIYVCSIRVFKVTITVYTVRLHLRELPPTNMVTLLAKVNLSTALCQY